MKKAVITVIGKDRVGIIHGVSGVLCSGGVNILDISQTIMQELFTMVMLVDVQHSTVSFEDLKAQLEALRGAELRRILQILAGTGMGKVDGEFPVEIQLQKLPVETLRRVMFEIQKMQEEDYVACVECVWN